MVSEAQFAATIREYPRAEGLLVKATKLTPDNGEYWVTLGSVRMQLGHRDAARDAYRRALSAFEDQADAHPGDAGPKLQQVYVLALLGRADDARSRLARFAKKYPDNMDIRLFVEGKRLDDMLADPGFRKLSL